MDNIDVTQDTVTNNNINNNNNKNNNNKNNNNTINNNININNNKFIPNKDALKIIARILVLSSNKFESILSYSLISKEFFYICREEIKNNILKLDIKLKIGKIMSYSNNVKEYDRKLIPYKSLTDIKLYDWYESEEEIDMVQRNLPRLARIHHDPKVYVYRIGYNQFGYGGDVFDPFIISNHAFIYQDEGVDHGLLYDPTFEGRVIFNKVLLSIHKDEGIPCSNLEEYYRYQIYGKVNTQFSFDFLNKYNATKLFIKGEADNETNFQGLDGIALNCTSIYSILFDIKYKLFSSSSFIKRAIESPHITKLRLSLQRIDTYDFNYLYQGVSNNNSRIEKLLLFGDVSYSNNDLNSYLNYINGHATLKSISLDVFDINHVDQLNRLFQLQNIVKLYTVIYEHNLVHRLVILRHALSNDNIKYINIYHGSDYIKQTIQLLVQEAQNKVINYFDAEKLTKKDNNE